MWNTLQSSVSYRLEPAGYQCTATHNVRLWQSLGFSRQCTFVYVHMMWRPLGWSFTVQWCGEAGFSANVKVSGKLYEHRRNGVCECVRWWGPAVKPSVCVMRNVDAHRERGQATKRPPSTCIVCLLISLLHRSINTSAKVQPCRKLISYYLIILFGFSWNVTWNSTSAFHQ